MRKKVATFKPVGRAKFKCNLCRAQGKKTVLKKRALESHRLFHNPNPIVYKKPKPKKEKPAPPPPPLPTVILDWDGEFSHCGGWTYVDLQGAEQREASCKYCGKRFMAVRRARPSQTRPSWSRSW